MRRTAAAATAAPSRAAAANKPTASLINESGGRSARRPNAAADDSSETTPPSGDELTGGATPWPPALRSHARVSPFVFRLFELVSEPDTSHICRWNEQGDAFEVADEARFATEVLPRYFKHHNISSFVRQLSTYGFRKSWRGKFEYSHPFFLRDRQDLLVHIPRKTRRKNTTAGVTSASVVGNVLDPSLALYERRGAKRGGSPDVDLVSMLGADRSQRLRTESMLAMTGAEGHGGDSAAAAPAEAGVRAPAATRTSGAAAELTATEPLDSVAAAACLPAVLREHAGDHISTRAARDAAAQLIVKHDLQLAQVAARLLQLTEQMRDLVQVVQACRPRDPPPRTTAGGGGGARTAAAAGGASPPSRSALGAAIVRGHDDGHGERGNAHHASAEDNLALSTHELSSRTIQLQDTQAFRPGSPSW